MGVSAGRRGRTRKGAVDRSIGVLRFDELDGTMAAVLSSYECHPTVSLEGDWIDADYPG
jgi:hypothetical protein